MTVMWKWNGLTGSHARCMLACLRNCQSVFQSGCILFHSHQQCVWAPVSPSLTRVILFSVSHSKSSVVVPSCSLSLHFSSDKGYRASSHMLICYPYTSLGEVPVQIFCQFLIFVFWPSCKHFVYSSCKSFVKSMFCNISPQKYKHVST